MSTHNNKNSSSKLRCRVTFLTRLALFVALLLPVSPLTAATANKPATVSHAADDEARWFQVELILFSHQTDLALDAEQWPDIEGLKLPEKVLELHLPQLQPPAEELLAPADNASSAEAGTVATTNTNPTLEMATEGDSYMPVAYQILPEDQLQLTDMAKQLQRSSKGGLLLHIAWQQPTYDREHAEPVYFATGMAEPLPVVESGSEITTDDSQPIPNEGTLLSALEYASEEDLKIGPIEPTFFGTLT